MAVITILPENIRNLIAAGEVVERPASVVKELVENSLDADSTEVVIEIACGGLEYISVSDNGIGMDRDDIALSVKSHATSKLKTVDDLSRIMTMGFRGEALSSIAEVSRFAIESKPRGDGLAVGYRLVIEGGRRVSFEEMGLVPGTRVEVRDLFFNVPARKKFSRSPRTEFGHIRDVVERLALANPGVSFRLISDGKEILSAFAMNDPSQRAVEIFGAETVKKTYICGEDSGEIRIHGLVGDPSISLEGGGGLYWFVNKRPIKDRVLNHAAVEAYRSLLPKDVSPFSILFIAVPPEMVDINVHPTKSEVRFANSSAVHDFVAAAVKKTLGRKRTMPKCRGIGEVEGWPPPFDSAHGRQSPVTTCSSRLPWQPLLDFGRDMQSSTAICTDGPFSSLRIIGQFAKTYLLCERDDGSLLVIDQHAAHERIRYERLKEAYRARRVEKQGILTPEMVELPAALAGCFEEALSDISSIGWDIEHFGGSTFCVKACPSLLSGVDVRRVVRAMAEEMVVFQKSASHDEKIDALMKVTACHGSARAGNMLSEQEIRHLLCEMDAYEWADRCPHGRRAVHEIPPKDIKKWFDR